MRDKVALITFHTGFNYGTSLQAYAMNELIKECGYEPVMLWHKDSFIKGRDITIAKLLVMFFRAILHPFASKKVFGAYKDNYSYKISDETKDMFLTFENNFFDVKKMSYKNMKKLCSSKEIKAVCCGSDQIWKSNLLYVSPYYFLRFAPQNKRIAYAPSFGNCDVPDYNKKILSKYLREFKTLSIREETGAQIIKKLTGINCPVNLDPTLAVDSEVWRRFLWEEKNNNYILCYFLDEPTETVLENIRVAQKKFHYDVRVIPYIYNSFSSFENCYFENAGPIEFLNLVFNAKIIFTDSFHCSIFSVLFCKSFYVFERNHRNSISGNTRIENLMNLMKLQDRFIKNNSVINFSSFSDCDFSLAANNIMKEREKSLRFLKSAIGDINVCE